jgi:hypothetical protein
MTRKFLVFLIVTATLLGPASKPSGAAVFAVSSDDDPAYIQGTKAMNDQRWSDAVLSFEQVIDAKGKKADAALYWKAYSLNKIGKQQLSAGTCLQLYKQFKASAWNEDCRVLVLSLGGAQNSLADPSNLDPEPRPGPHPHPNPHPYPDPRPRVLYGPEFAFKSENDPDLEIKVLALNSVMRRDPAQAIPVLRGILSGDQSEAYKQHALFILAQSNSPDAQAMMHDLVLGKLAPSLQELAIRDCSIYQGKRLNDTLAEAYGASNDDKIKRAVISAFFISGDDTHLVDLARQEKDLKLKRTIVSQLSLMQGKTATDYMMELLK